MPGPWKNLIDGRKWEVCGVQEGLAIRSPHIAVNIGTARYLKVTIHAGTPGLWEFRVF